MPEIYLIAIMDFCFDNTNTQFYEKLGYIFIEMPKFKKKDTELETGEDAWLFSLRHMGTLTEIPVSLRDKEEFVKLFKIAEVSNLNPDEMSAYEASLKIARDNYSHDETVRKEAELKGKIEGKYKKAVEIAIKLIAKNTSIEDIAELTGLSKEEIESL